MRFLLSAVPDRNSVGNPACDSYSPRFPTENQTPLPKHPPATLPLPYIRGTPGRSPRIGRPTHAYAYACVGLGFGLGFDAGERVRCGAPGAGAPGRGARTRDRRKGCGRVRGRATGGRAGRRHRSRWPPHRRGSDRSRSREYVRESGRAGPNKIFPNTSGPREIWPVNDACWRRH